jgi:hypothetical protein
MKASSFKLGLSLAAAGVFSPLSAFAQAAAPAAPAAAPAAPAAAPAAAAPAAAPVTAPEPAPTPATEPAPLAPKDTAAVPPAAPETAAAAAPAEAAPAAEPPPPAATITGYVDTAFHMNISKNSITSPAVYRAYDGPGGFILHAAHIAVGHSFSPEASAFVSLDFGSDATVNSLNYAQISPTGGIPADVREGYAKWTPGDFTLQAGKFVTLNGIEVVDGPLNPTITRGFLYWLAEPVGHTGAKANYALAEGKAHIGVGLVNGWDRLYDNNNQKTVLFNADFIPSPTFHAQISGSYGAENNNDDKNHRLTVDLTGGVVLDALTINFQGLVGAEPGVGAPDAAGKAQDDSWFGFGIQPVYTMDAFSLGARLEYFNNKHGSRVAQNQTIPGTPAMGAIPATPDTTALLPVDGTSLLNFTITPGYMLSKSFTLRAEFRIDAVMAAKNSAGGSEKNILNGKSSQATWALGATYAF